MPETKKQQRAAGAELGRRRRGVKKQKSGSASRPFGSASLKTLHDFASGPLKPGKKKS